MLSPPAWFWPVDWPPICLAREGYAASLMASSQEQEPRPVVAVIPGRLAASISGEDLLAVRREAWWKTAQEVASDWQSISMWAEWWELATAPAVQHGRAHELAGLIASGGEQLALALAALVETELWRSFREANPVDTTERGIGLGAANEMGHRAMAELAAYYLMSTGHGLANITARTLALDSQLHPHLLDALGAWCPVGSTDPRDWLSLNRGTAKALRQVARKSGSPPVQSVIEPITALALSEPWRELESRRGAHYHRRRPQSAGLAGVPFASPWIASGGAMSLNFGGREYTDGDGLAHDTSDLALRVLAELDGAMETLLARVKAVVDDIHDRARQSSRDHNPSPQG
jgi:hypothetical protein